MPLPSPIQLVESERWVGEREREGMRCRRNRVCVEVVVGVLAEDVIERLVTVKIGNDLHSTLLFLFFFYFFSKAASHNCEEREHRNGGKKKIKK